MAGMNWTQPRRLTFSMRMRLTSSVLLMLWKAWGGFLLDAWRSGATVSISRTGRASEFVRIETGNGRILTRSEKETVMKRQ